YHSPITASRRIVNLPSMSRPAGLWLEFGRTFSYLELAIRPEPTQTSTIAIKRMWRREGKCSCGPKKNMDPSPIRTDYAHRVRRNCILLASIPADGSDLAQVQNCALSAPL